VAPTGHQHGAGTPCLVMVVFRPFDTRSSKDARWVLASNAPMVPMAVYQLVPDRVISSLAAGEHAARGRGMPRPYKGAV